MSELKPCPFCGNTPDIPKSLCFISVHCAFCECEMLVERWNTRTPTSLPRVRPEDLIEGEWYLVDRGPQPVIAKAVSEKWLFGIDEDSECVQINKYNFEKGIYGPLPKFRMEGE